jgi:hypothetical protein
LKSFSSTKYWAARNASILLGDSARVESKALNFIRNLSNVLFLTMRVASKLFVKKVWDERPMDRLMYRRLSHATRMRRWRVSRLEMAARHTQLANAEQWRFLPRDDIQPGGE